MDNPRGLDGKAAVGLPAGSRGTIVCCGFNGADFSVFVSWDRYTLGTTAGALCGTPAGNYPVNSGWWVRCDQIAPLAGDPTSCSEDTLIIKQISYSQWRVLLNRDPRCPATSRPFATCITVSVGTSNAVVSTRVTPLAGITGTWNATATRLPNSGSNGTVYKVCVSSNGMDLTSIPAGVTTEVARLVLTVQ